MFLSECYSLCSLSMVFTSTDSANQNIGGKKLEKKIPESSRKQNLNLPRVKCYDESM